ncbi:nucleotide exchange factor GrpE [Paenibacillus radicis (ex Xue et al. 2023)]|uniref:Protein GrpE n=1 Tax=Paenibacillus radicis (ex Xue et al. 2023) TaxID=2972489 RepID=A0ABT1YE35_9BACL|nr:nucleotide exchange factor GrpE [Paenibacillus radicis (ex Xue et al. 2023)]MCR8631451.1 nucleotide exchange factor GrpE [Paenibacillus radicis (ex Xue et al. 2023)]
MSANQKNQTEVTADTEQNVDTTYPGDVENANNMSTEAEEAAQEQASEQELEQLRKESEENYQRYLRAQADFDNFRRRTRLEKEEFAKYASMKVIEQLLPVLDNLERALNAGQEGKDYEALHKGVDMISRQLDQALANEGLQAMESVGQPFNPEFHQAIMQVESEEHEEGIVVEEIQKGYLLKDKVLRPAMVKVSS